MGDIMSSVIEESGHIAHCGFRFYNPLETGVRLVGEISKGSYIPAGFVLLEERVIPPGGYYYNEQNLPNYVSLSSWYEEQEMMKIYVNVGQECVGHVVFARTSRPDPRVRFETNQGSNYKLRIKRSRFGGGGAATLEVVPKDS